MDSTQIQHELGYAYLYSFPNDGLYRFISTYGDDVNKENVSKLVVYEDQFAIGPSSSGHASIRKTGLGSYSHWKTYIYFSSADNSNPKENGSEYSYSIPIKLSARGWKGCALINAALFAVMLYLGIRKGCAPSMKGSITNCLRVWALIFHQSGFLVLALFLFLGLFYLRFEALPDDELKRILNEDVSSVIISSQMQRAAKMETVDTLFIGDSSCLMGIDYFELARKEGVKIESLCTIGYLAPDGYAEILKIFAEKMTVAPKKLIIAMHPFSMHYESNWGRWLDFVEASGRPLPAKGSDGYVDLFRSWINRKFVSQLIQAPMSGRIGMFYGDITRLEKIIMNDGQLIDPSTGLLATEDINAIVQHELQMPNRNCSSIKSWPNDAFLKRLKMLRVVVEKMEIEEVRFVVTPVSAECDISNWQSQSERTSMLAQTLGIDPSDVLEFDGILPASKFSSFTHLNRKGRDDFTMLLRRLFSVTEN